MTKPAQNNTVGQRFLYAQGVKSSDAKRAKGEFLLPSHQTDPTDVRWMGVKRTAKQLGAGVLSVGLTAGAGVLAERSLNRQDQVSTRFDRVDVPATVVPTNERRLPAGPVGAEGEIITGVGVAEVPASAATPAEATTPTSQVGGTNSPSQP